jgi:hypothetical protein
MLQTHGHIPKSELTDRSIAVSSAILQTPEDDQCWSKHAYTSDAEEILTFKTFKGFKKQVESEMANN